MDKARSYTTKPIRIAASTQASDTLALHSRTSITSFLATQVAARKAFRLAQKTPDQVQVAEVHDNFTIAEILAIEDLGFFPKGQGGKATMDGETALGGKVTVNPSGGLKARGFPFGATGVAQVVELVQQLRGEAGKRQVPDANLGLAQNTGGTGATVVVTLLEVA
jgi:acetyl-CoA C-acetyltransferase